MKGMCFECGRVVIREIGQERENNVKSYKQLAEETRKKVIEKQDSGAMKDWDCLIDSWLALLERDRETPEEVKAEQYRDMMARIEKAFETATPRRYFSLTFCYVAVRQKLEPPESEEKEARMIHVAP